MKEQLSQNIECPSFYNQVNGHYEWHSNRIDLGLFFKLRERRVRLSFRSLKVTLDANALAHCHCRLEINRKSQHKNFVCVSLWV